MVKPIQFTLNQFSGAFKRKTELFSIMSVAHQIAPVEPGHFPMRFEVRTLREKGISLPSSAVKARPPYVGMLRVREVRDIELNRAVLQARLLDSTTQTDSDLLPSLEDAKLISMEKGELRLTGIERLPDLEVPQTWVVKVDL